MSWYSEVTLEHEGRWYPLLELCDWYSHVHWAIVPQLYLLTQIYTQGDPGVRVRVRVRVGVRRPLEQQEDVSLSEDMKTQTLIDPHASETRPYM